MSRTDRRFRMSLIPVFAMLLATAPGCSATGGRSYPNGQLTAPGASGRVAYRPFYNELFRPKTLYLTGYAGATYPPVVNPTPTAYGVRTGGLFGGHGTSY